MHFQAKSKDDEELYRCAKFCYQSAEPLLASLPRTREAQAILVNFLRTQIVESGQGFSIGVDFLIERMGCTDANLVGKWSDAPADFAWLMVHPQFSNYFARFVIDNWNPQLYVIHHVPKSAGTSLYELINDQSYFIAYPQINFDAMCKTNGLLGFAHQLARFESRQISQDRIYVGGHFNLPNMLARLGGHDRWQGISLTRSPLESISSAVRYVWTLLEQSDPGWAPDYPSLAPERLTQIRVAGTRSPDPAALAELRNVVDAIMQAPIFRSNYDELLCKYYYNDTVDDPISLTALFGDYRNLSPCIDMARDKELILRQLRIEGEMPRANVSLFSHRDLVRAFGGDEAFSATVAPKLFRSAEVFGALSALHTLNRVMTEAPLAR